MNRKTFLVQGLSSLTSLSVFGFSSKKDKSNCWTQTDDLGPFYRENVPLNNPMVNDANTSKLRISGIVFDGELCDKALAKATIDVWHADQNGVYDNSSPKFAFRTKIVTNKSGEYGFKTLMPGHYGNRPRHIHFKVQLDGYYPLITQLYFKHDEANFDYLSKQANVERILRISKRGDVWEGTFNLYLRKYQ